jgi:hypothetical protein
MLNDCQADCIGTVRLNQKQVLHIKGKNITTIHKKVDAAEMVWRAGSENCVLHSQ